MVGWPQLQLRIQPIEEESVIKAVKQPEEKVMEMATVYAARDDQDFLAKGLLTYATDVVTGEVQGLSGSRRSVRSLQRWTKPYRKAKPSVHPAVVPSYFPAIL